MSIGDRPLIALGGPALLRVVKLADVKATARRQQARIPLSRLVPSGAKRNR